MKDDDRELLSSYGEFFPGHPGTVLIEEGTVQTHVLVVITGKLEVHARQEDGTEQVLAYVGPGETLGEISLFNPGPAAATVTAVEFSQLWRIADADLMEFMQENPGAGNLLLRTLASILAQRLRQMNPKAFGLSTYAVVDSPELARQAPTGATAPGAEEIAEEDAVLVEPETESMAPITTGHLTSTPPPIETAAPVEPAAAPIDIPQTYQNKRVSTKTQIVPDPDEIEPI